MSGRGQYTASPHDEMSGFGSEMDSEDEFMDIATTENHNPPAAIQFSIEFIQFGNKKF